MPKVFKTFFAVLGFLLIGLGIGLIIPRSVQIEESYYWLVIIFTLILGGFFVGLGVVAQTPEKRASEKRAPEKKEIKDSSEEKASKEEIIQE